MAFYRLHLVTRCQADLGAGRLEHRFGPLVLTSRGKDKGDRITSSAPVTHSTEVDYLRIRFYSDFSSNNCQKKKKMDTVHKDRATQKYSSPGNYVLSNTLMHVPSMHSCTHMWEHAHTWPSPETPAQCLCQYTDQTGYLSLILRLRIRSHPNLFHWHLFIASVSFQMLRHFLNLNLLLPSAEI